MDFTITAMPTEIADALRADVAAGRLPAERILLDVSGGPCRHCLRSGAAGEELLLFTWQPFRGESPYAVPSPIFLHAEPCARFDSPGTIPELVRTGDVRNVRAYDTTHHLLDGEVVDGADLESSVARLFGDERADYLHVYSATAGCFTFRVDRVA